MKPVIVIALVGLGVAIGFIVASALGAGVSINLIIGLLLVIAGAIVGFVIEWLIDESIRKNRALEQQLERQQAKPAFVPSTAGATPPKPASPAGTEALADILQQHNQELHQLGEQIAAKDNELETLRHKFETYQQTHPDELTNIKGIGPVYQRKLRDIGLNSFEQLANAKADQIRRLLDIKKWQRVDIESWMQQARDWAEHS